MAWLALLLRSETEKPKESSKNQNGRTKSGHKKTVDDQKSLFFWELISAHFETIDCRIVCLEAWVDKSPQPLPTADSYTRHDAIYLSEELLTKVKGPLKLRFEVRAEASPKPADQKRPIVASPPDIYANIASRISKSNTTAGDRDSEEAASVLCKVIEKAMAFLCNTNGVAWKQPIQALVGVGAQKETLQACCEFDIREGRASNYYDNAEQFSIVLQRKSQQPWSVVNRSQLQAAISLSFYTNAFRRKRANDQKAAAHKVSERGLGGKAGCVQRIIGYGTHDEAESLAQQIQMWVERGIQRSTLPVMQNIRDPPLVEENISYRPPSGLLKKQQPRRSATISVSYLGMFLSSCLEEPPVSPRCFKELWISKPPEVTEAFEYAQELFSIFILALTSQIDQVNGGTEEIDRKSECSERLFENAVFKSIADIVVGEKLAASMDEAYVLIIPAFAKHKLLPNCPGPQSPTC